MQTLEKSIQTYFHTQINRLPAEDRLLLIQIKEDVCRIVHNYFRDSQDDCGQLKYILEETLGADKASVLLKDEESLRTFLKELQL